jgi:aspartyl-tRNA synthetase
MQAPGLGYIVFEEEAGALVGRGPIAKFVPQPVVERMAERAGVKPGDALFFACAKGAGAAALAGAARIRIGDELGLSDKERFDFCWIVDFPMFEWNDEDKKIDFSHNPFSMPQGGLEALRPGTRSTFWPISTTSCATGSSCRRAPSATTSRRS